MFVSFVLRIVLFVLYITISCACLLVCRVWCCVFFLCVGVDSCLVVLSAMLFAVACVRVFFSGGCFVCLFWIVCYMMCSGRAFYNI